MKQKKYKTTGRIGFFDKDETSSKLSKLGNPLEKLHSKGRKENTKYTKINPFAYFAKSLCALCG